MFSHLVGARHLLYLLDVSLGCRLGLNIIQKINTTLVSNVVFVVVVVVVFAVLVVMVRRWIPEK